MRNAEETIQFLKDIVAGSKNINAALKGRKCYLLCEDAVLRTDVETDIRLNLNYSFNNQAITMLKRSPIFNRTDKIIRERGDTFYIQLKNIMDAFENINMAEARFIDILLEKNGDYLFLKLFKANKRKKQKIFLREEKILIGVEKYKKKDFSVSFKAFPFIKIVLKAFSPYVRIGLHITNATERCITFFQNTKENGKINVVIPITKQYVL